MLHMTAATVLHTPELMLSEEETKQYVSVYEEFSKYHDMPGLTPKRMSEIALIAFVVPLYGSRFIAWRNRMNEEKRKPKLHVMPDKQQPQQQPNVQ